MSRNLYIYVIDGNSDAGDWLDSLFTIGDKTVVNVLDMVQKVLHCVGENRIRSLFIGGHGRPGFQSVGAGTSLDPIGLKSLQIDSAGSIKGNFGIYLKALRGRFSHDAIVTLGGCETGKGEVGTDLLNELSRVLGVPVEAGVENQRPFVPGMEGQIKRCSSGTCILLPSTWWGSPGGGGIN